MKTKIIFFFISYTFLFIGCKKETSNFENESKINFEFLHNSVQKHVARGVPLNVSLHEKGFLVFPTLEDFCDFTDFMDSSTHIEMQEYLESLQFNSIGSNIYTGGYLYEPISADQQVDYVYGEDAIVQIQGVIMKAIENNSFLLTVTEENFADEVYLDLVDSIYDENKMNKFATNPTEGFDLFEFISNTPYGHEDTVPNESVFGRKFWGWECVSNQGLYPVGNCIVEACIAHHCIFWICGTEQPHILSINCSD